MHTNPVFLFDLGGTLIDSVQNSATDPKPAVPGPISQTSRWETLAINICVIPPT